MGCDINMEGEKKTCNSLNQIVPGSKVIYEDEVYNVGQIKGNMIELYKCSFYAGMVNINDVDVL